MSLREQILAEIERGERDTQALGSLPSFVDTVDSCTCYGGTPYGHESGCGTEPGPAWWAIGALRSRYAHYRKVLERHRPLEANLSDPHLGWLLDYFGGALPRALPQCLHGRSGILSESVPWPCPEILDLAEALGLSTEAQP